MAEEVTYADLRFMTLEQPRKQELHGANTKDAPTPSPYWRIVAMILGLFCLGFMATAGVLVVKFTQVSHLMSEREMQENLTQQLELLQAQNLNLSKTLEQLASSRGHKCTPCPENWLQHGENCYYYFAEWKTWQESEALCSSLDSRFLKIESKKELDFVMKTAQLYSSYSFWIGLSHNGAGQPWLWEDGTPFSSDLFRIPEASSSSSLVCVWIQGTNVSTAECSDYKFCICEKMVNPPGIGQKRLIRPMAGRNTL